MLQIWDGRDSRASVDPSEFVTDMLEKARIGKRIVPIETRAMPVLFTPKGFADTFCLPLLIAFNGKEVLQGATPVSDKMGKQALDPRVSIYDDGTIDLNAGSRPFDDEGTAVRRLPLVEKGAVSNFIYDLDTAVRAGANPTGHGRRDLSSLPSPAYNGIIIEPGDVSIENMIRGVKNGLLVDQVMGAWSGNVRGGDFSGNVHYGIKIENGKMVGRVKDTMVTGNVFEALKNVEAIENRSHPLTGPLAALPHLLFPALSVSARG
jgi:PmbA protein